MSHPIVVLAVLPLLTLSILTLSLAASAPPPATLPELAVTVHEDRYDAPPTISSGPTRVRLTNDSTAPHDLMVFKFRGAPDRTALLAALTKLASHDGHDLEGLVESYGGTATGPGVTGEFMVDLAAGDYALFSPDDSGIRGIPGAPPRGACCGC